MSRLPVRGSLCGLLLILVASCGGSSTDVQEPVATTLRLSLTTVELTFLGQSRSVSATLLDASGTTVEGAVAWASDDPGVATVSAAGVIRATGNGSTTVRASAGGLSGTVDVTVEQVPTFLAVLSGNDQSGIAGTPLSEPVVVRVQDQGGSPVSDVEVTFTPDENSGSVDPVSEASGSDGLVSMTWTLGTQFGPQRAVASIEVSQAQLRAFAGSETPTPDLLLTNPVRVFRGDPTAFDTLRVRATVRNRGDGEAEAFRVLLRVDGADVATRDVMGLGAFEEQTVEFADVGPLAAGTRAVEVVLDSDSAVVELDETNNVGSRDLVVLDQQQIEPGTSVSGLSAGSGEDILFRVEVPGPTNLTLELAGGSGDVDLWVAAGSRPVARTDYDDCISDGPTMRETCQLPGADGTYHVIVHGAGTSASGFTNSTLTVTLGDPVEPFNLELVFIDNGTPSQDQAFLEAAAIWSSVIVGDIPDYDLGSEVIPSNACIDGMPSVGGVIDDVIVYAAIRPNDGEGKTLAKAGPCFVRNGSGLPIIGVMEFDEADLDRLELDGDMREVVLHEMGHVLGLGTIWSRRDLLQDPSTSGSGEECTVFDPDADTHFIGALAIQAFDEAGGTGYGGSKVPVANGELGATCSSADGHWRESVMRTELMTPFLNSQSVNPLSAITIQSLADLGYAMDETQAEPYTLPSIITQAPAPDAVSPADGSRLIDLGGDLYSGPVWVMEQGGRVVRVLR